ncbi:hypothetical protein E2562_034380 [Oryza meyeriana var. granulata]|uniref:Uncharacterized protein n=1 Tax=Oryza meyeriana var. granulata TaxID=110450 RepID=A0A6G1CLM6_9ORYZ|nr:hypothetical protein E2562_034380 [Oryza meyeriana var. granulata]
MENHCYTASAGLVGLCIASVAVAGAAAAEHWDRPCWGLALCLAFHAGVALVIRAVSARRRHQ